MVLGDWKPESRQRQFPEKRKAEDKVILVDPVDKPPKQEKLSKSIGNIKPDIDVPSISFSSKPAKKKIQEKEAITERTKRENERKAPFYHLESIPKASAEQYSLDFSF